MFPLQIAKLQCEQIELEYKLGYTTCPNCKGSGKVICTKKKSKNKKVTN